MLIACPGCQRQLNVPEQTAGQQVRCPLCQVVFQAPVSSEVPASGPPASAPPPPAYEPPPASAPAPPAYEPAPGRQRPAAQDYDYEEQRRGGPISEHAYDTLRRGSIHLLVCAIIFTVMFVINTILDFIMVGMVQMGHSDAYYAGVCVGLVVRLVFIATPVVFMFIGSNLLRQARGRGLVLTAGILTIVLAGLCTIGLIVSLIGLTQFDRLYHGRAGTALFLSAISMLLVLAATVYGYIAGIMTLNILGRPEVKEAYGLHAPRRRRARRDRYDDAYEERRNRHDDEHW